LIFLRSQKNSSEFGEEVKLSFVTERFGQVQKHISSTRKAEEMLDLRHHTFEERPEAEYQVVYG